VLYGILHDRNVTRGPYLDPTVAAERIKSLHVELETASSWRQAAEGGEGEPVKFCGGDGKKRETT